ncbi:glycosyltransferase family 4 protein [Aminipila sp.]|uniref:glycosyltransferase family 4 protein n=1 Tax=Aminipila sp. TaxID=2060095 RepID=UPI00289F8090|nr:glycosyltransferase family 4 protein [Aminipila sp.]
MKNEVLIISHFSENEDNISNDRLKYIAGMIGKSYLTELLTSSFLHTAKKHSLNKKEQHEFYTTTYIDEPGYQRNVSIKRFISHFRSGKNLKRYLKSIQCPKMLYCAVPSLSWAFVATRFALRNRIPIVIDIQDLWPEAFKMVFNPWGLGNIIYYPMKRIADYIYQHANAVISVSDTYCRRAELGKTERKFFLPVYIGTSFERFDKILPHQQEQDIFYLIYVGTLGHSYDLKCAIDAYGIVKQNKNTDLLKFLILGDGPLEQEFKRYARDKNLDVEFKGRLKYEEMVSYLKSAHIAINPINGKSVASIINKHADYAAAGLPVISTQDSQEYKILLEKYNAGFNCECGDSQQMARYIIHLLTNEETWKEMAANSRKLGEAVFNRDTSYIKIEELIRKILKK